MDEIHSDSDRTIFVEHLEAFLGEFPKIRLVVTSREAGFALIAPNMMRFCTRWRIAPLAAESIRLLSDYWHTLMGGVAAEAEAESVAVVDTILRNSALTRLAENPLLLTMLLVVKHGHGRLPPDRVSLYDRAVEVLLDTWNIKGHDALNPREAVPQLAYIAFRMMGEGKQTATEPELLKYVEECRQNVPLVKLYARDTPIEFLKRVELRSSLLLEGGRVRQGLATLPFYQFRHLTFQEYLAAVSVVDGHYDQYQQGDSPLTPLKPVLLTEEWKEVVPMAAVLAKKQADPIISALIADALERESAFLLTEFESAHYQWSSSYRMPSSVARLTQCLIEEAEFSREALKHTLRLTATFAHGCQSGEDWSALSKGPFGQALFDSALELYRGGGVPKQAWLRNTVSILAGYRRTGEEWKQLDSLRQLREGLVAPDDQIKCWAAASICGVLWLYVGLGKSIAMLPILADFQADLEANLASPDNSVFELSAWSLGLIHARSSENDVFLPHISESAIQILLVKWFTSLDSKGDSIAGFTLSSSLRFERSEWKPTLSTDQRQHLVQILNEDFDPDQDIKHSSQEAALLICYHARDVVTESLIVERMKKLRSYRPHKKRLSKLLLALENTV